MKAILITGSSRGLGKHLALVFAENNYKVILHGRNKKDLNDVAKQIPNSNIVIGDLRNEQTINNLYEVAKRKDIDVLINNAAHSQKSPLEELTNKQIDYLISVNLTAQIKLTKRIYEYFLEKKQGTIININSGFGLEAGKLYSVYCATKWGLTGFAKSLRKESDKIKIINIYPSRIRTRKTCEDFGMQPRDVANEIYKTFKLNKNGLIIDDRPNGIVKIKYVD